VIDTQSTEVATTTITVFMGVFYAAVIAFLMWLLLGKRIRRWWRRRKLNIPGEDDVRTISGPTWSVKWVKVSQIKEKRPDEENTTVLGETQRDVFEALKAKYGDEFDERNIISTEKRPYLTVLVGIPDRM